MGENSCCRWRVGALHLDGDGSLCGQFADRPGADDLAVVDDGHLVAGPLDLIQQVRGQHDRPSLINQAARIPGRGIFLAAVTLFVDWPAPTCAGMGVVLPVLHDRDRLN